MRVLMLNPSFSGAGYVHSLSNALTALGADVHLYSGPHFTRVTRGLRVDYQPHIRFYRQSQLRSYGPGTSAQIWRAARLVTHNWSMLRTVLDAPAFDVVHVHFPPVPALDAWWLATLARAAPLVLTVHNLVPHGHDLPSTPSRTWRRIHATPHLLISHTDATTRGLQDIFGIAATCIRQIPMGNYSYLHTIDGAPTPDDLGLRRAGTPTLLVFGQLRANKGIDVAIEALGALRTRGVAARLLVAGPPDSGWERYPALARRLGIEDAVEFRVAQIPEHHVPAYFEAADVVVLPYRSIDQSAVAVTAISLGRPVVVTNVGGLPALVERGECGLVVPPDDPAALATAVAQLIGDPARRSAMENAALAYAGSALAWEPIARATLDAYRDAGRLAGQSTGTPTPE